MMSLQSLSLSVHGITQAVVMNIQLFGVFLVVFRTLILVGRVGPCIVLEMLI
jgi:hypothetical protein